MIAIATILNLAMIWKRNMREFAIVGAWALVAIFVRHQNDFKIIAYSALAGSILLVINAGIHGFQNRDTNPGKKFMERFKG